MLEPWQLGLLFGVAVAAGFVDAIAGGGGMITLPALLVCGLDPGLALGTNKLQACFGSGGATWHFARLGMVDWGECRRGVALTLAGAALGAGIVQRLDSGFLASLIPALLISAAAFLLCRPAFGAVARRPRLARGAFDAMCGIGIGFYDGFLGPGTGTFWAMAFVLLLGLDLVGATARAKVMNFTSNMTALLLFVLAGKVAFATGLAMGAGQLLGARLGAHLVIRRGSRFVRTVMLAVVIALAVKLLLDGA